MEPENQDIEIKSVEEGDSGSAFSARVGGEASVTVRLLTQDEFDRLEREKAERAAKE